MKIFAGTGSSILLFSFLIQNVFAVVIPSDVVGNKYEKPISYLYEQGIVNGYPDGTFKPNSNLNRAELLKFVLGKKGTGVSAGVYRNCFPDVGEEWFAKYVCYAESEGFVDGYPDGYFRPGNQINKVEAIKIFVNVNGVVGGSSVDLPFTDLIKGIWYEPYLRVAYSAGLLEEKSGKFYPGNFMNRGQISEIVYRYLVGESSYEDIADEGGDNVEELGQEVIVQTDKDRFTEADFKYLGAFRMPAEDGGASRFGYGGWAMALNPNGDPNGADDGFPGSFYIVGHDYDQMVAEISIPVPKDQRSVGMDSLNRAHFIQKFVDVTQGLGETLDGGNGWRIGGLAYLDGRLYWTARTYYNVSGETNDTHGFSNADFSNLEARGLWSLGNYHSNMTAGYIFSVPEYFANAYLEGKRLISGLFTQQGVSLTSQGPAFFAYDPLQDGLPENGSVLDVIALTFYPYSIEGAREIGPDSYETIGNFPDFQVPDGWGGATWVYNDQKDAVLVVGQRAMGTTYYGEARSGDCNIYKGYHGTPYEPRILFYDTGDLADVAQGLMEPDEPIPYLEWNPQEYFVDSCEWELMGVAYDFENQLLYVLQKDADVEGEPTPLIYIFRVS